MFVRAVFGVCLVTFVCGTHHFTPVIDTRNFPLNFTATTNAACRSDIDLLAKSLQNNTLWAYRTSNYILKIVGTTITLAILFLSSMQEHGTLLSRNAHLFNSLVILWDSSAKLPLGLSEGSQYQFGNFDECLSISEPFTTQYCLATITIDINVNKTIHDRFSLEYRPYMNLYEKLDYTNDPNVVHRNKILWGLCMPISCKSEDIRTELQLYLDGEHNSNIKQYNVELNYNDCQNQQTGYSYTTVDYLFCCVIGTFLILTGICTAYDLKYIDENKGDDMKKKKSVKLLLCFSAKENFHDLVKPEGSNKNFRIFYGTKFFLMFSLIFGHSLINMMTGSVFNINYIEQINRSLLFMPVCRGDVVVDLFFFIGGLLNTYSYLVQAEKKTFNAMRSIILRYFRIVPVFAIITFFYSTLFYKMGSGPLWSKTIGPEKSYCDKNWWTNLLLLNNYINVDNMCIVQGWYLGVDFQMFILSIPLNYLIKKDNKLCWTLFSTILLGSILTPFWIIYLGKKDPFFFVYNDFFGTIRQNDYFQSIYIPSYTRMSTYILGMILGFGYYKLRDKKFQISFAPSMLIFSISTITACICMFSGVVFYNPYLPYNALKAALYSSLHRPAFVIAGGVALFVLSFGSIPQHLLIWSPMIPLSKLSFTAYLVHFVFQLTKVGSQRTPVNFSIYYWACQAVLELMLSLSTAFLLFIFIENPCIRFMKLIIPTNCCKSTNIISSSRQVY